MRHVRTSELARFVGQRVEVRGWLHTLRKLGKITFGRLRDGVGTVQVVVTPDAAKSLGEAGVESVLAVEARVAPTSQTPEGFELVDPRIEVLVRVAEALPVPHGPASDLAKLPTLLDHAAVTLRDPSRRAAFELAAGAVRGFRDMLDDLGFVEIHTPKFLGSATESGANVFGLDYFGRPAFLAQSPQFYKQTMVGVFERVYEVGPVFRAEPHATVRHLAQYVSLDAETGFIEDHRDVAEVLRRALAGIVERWRSHHASALERLDVVVPNVPERWVELDFVEAQRLLETHTGRRVVGEPDLSPADERWLGQWAMREHGSDFVLVTGYPMAKRPFYTHPMPERPEFSNSFDLLFRGTELVTGGQRLHRYDDVADAADRAGIGADALGGYLEAFRFGLPPHGGFAIGLERLVAQLIGAPNIRLTTLFPRDRNRLSP